MTVPVLARGPALPALEGAPEREESFFQVRLQYDGRRLLRLIVRTQHPEARTSSEGERRAAFPSDSLERLPTPSGRSCRATSLRLV